MLYRELSSKVIGGMYRVHEMLGSGLLEAPYHNALFYELRKHLRVSYKVPYAVLYEGEVVGEYFADLLVEGKIIIEVKSVSRLSREHSAQLINYLRISGCQIGILVNFRNTTLEFKRYILSG